MTKTDDQLTLAELNTLMDTIRRDTPSKWVICMPWKEEKYYQEHPPSEEELELLTRKYGAMRVSSRGIEEWRMPDRLWKMLRQMEEFKEFQQI